MEKKASITVADSVSDYIKNAPKQSTKPFFRRFVTGEPKNTHDLISVFPSESTSGFLTTLRTEKKKRETHSPNLNASDIANYLVQIVIKTKNGSNHEYPRLVYWTKGTELTEDNVSKFPAKDLDSIFNLLFCARPKGIDHLKKVMSLNDVPTIGTLTTSDEVKKMRIAKLQVDITWYTKVYMDALKSEREQKKIEFKPVEEDLSSEHTQEKNDKKDEQNKSQQKKNVKFAQSSSQDVTMEDSQELQWIAKKKKRKQDHLVQTTLNVVDPMSDESGYGFEMPDILNEALGLTDILRNPDFLTNPYIKSNPTQDEVVAQIAPCSSKMTQYKKVSVNTEPNIPIESIPMYILYFVVQEKKFSMSMIRHIMEQKNKIAISELENNLFNVWKTFNNDIESQATASLISRSLLMFFDQLYNPGHKSIQNNNTTMY